MQINLLTYDVAKLKSVSECRTVMARARARNLPEVYSAVFRRMCQLVGGENDDPADPLVKDFFETLAAYEQLLTEKNGRSQPAHRTRQKVSNKGVYQSLIDWTRGKTETEGFKLLVEAGLPEFTGEYLVAKYAERFPEDVVNAACERLMLHSISLPNPRMVKPSIEDTIHFIRAAHAGQVDKGGVEYWKHPVSVMQRLGPDASDDCKLVALLHDVIEDTEYTAASLRALGYPENVVSSVERLTKPKGVPYLKCIESLAASGDQMAIAVKIADNLDNLDPERLSKIPPNERGGEGKYRQSIEILTAARFQGEAPS